MTTKDDKNLTIAQALREAIFEEMQRDPRIFCIGEDIGIPGGWGGAFTVTLGIEKQFPERTINTPIAENGFFGAALGAATQGMIPIADVQYADFLFCAMDQIANQIPLMHYMSAGKINVPMLMRAPVGATGRGAQHAHSMESFFINIPGLQVVCPSNAYDAKGMLKAAVRGKNPVLMFEHKLLYGSKGARAEAGAINASNYIPLQDYTVALNQAKIVREGSDITILANLLMTHKAMHAAQALEKQGILAEVIDMCTLSPMDTQTMFASVKKTGRVLTVEESNITGGWGAQACAVIAEHCFSSLKKPPLRIGAPDTPVPFSPIMEKYYVPSEEKIIQAAQHMMHV